MLNQTSQISACQCHYLELVINIMCQMQLISCISFLFKVILSFFIMTDIMIMPIPRSLRSWHYKAKKLNIRIKLADSFHWNACKHGECWKVSLVLCGHEFALYYWNSERSLCPHFKHRSSCQQFICCQKFVKESLFYQQKHLVAKVTQFMLQFLTSNTLTNAHKEFRLSSSLAHVKTDTFW